MENVESKSHSRDPGLTNRANQPQPPQFLQGQQMAEMAKSATGPVAKEAAGAIREAVAGNGEG